MLPDEPAEFLPSVLTLDSSADLARWIEPYKHSTIGTFARLAESPPGDARGSSQDDLTAGFLGDYVYSVATRTYGPESGTTCATPPTAPA